MIFYFKDEKFIIEMKVEGKYKIYFGTERREWYGLWDNIGLSQDLIEIDFYLAALLFKKKKTIFKHHKRESI